MKLLICTTILLLFVVANVTSCGSGYGAEDQFGLDVEACRNETGASITDLNELDARMIPTTKIAKCFNACVMNKLGIMKENQFVPDELIKFAEMDDSMLKGTDGKTLKDATKDIVGDCKAVADPDKCEGAAKIRICLNDSAKKRGFCPNIF